ncbi:EF-hand domain-containing protein [Actomonas aquatica]|uniref:EF-hand domain-containing protein n=1 Tax=Actomonas aquatica TaxID=2866162 RepID=A0ABZ1C3R0_9BACT|nr:hypothetical protein [Opitutus sp. WL0086]WRQ86086.1 hypothetical protein K1X11_014825 [Opitutus sp. WL0086]
MNRKLVVTTLLAASAFGSSFLFAQTNTDAPNPPPGRGPGGTPPAWMIERFDTDGDGVLNAEERGVAHQAMMDKRQNGERPGREMMRNMRERFDADGDGRLSAEERATADATMRAEAVNRPRLMARIDTDKDGVISDAEWTAHRDALRDRMGKGKGKGMGQGGGGQGAGRQTN